MAVLAALIILALGGLVGWTFHTISQPRASWPNARVIARARRDAKLDLRRALKDRR